MRIGILQPGYLPWLGFFEQMYRSDIFVIYDDVQYDKDSWRNRNRIKTPNGTRWLTVPVRIDFEERPLINEVKIDNAKDWRKKHLFSIRQNYSKASFFKKYINIFAESLDMKDKKIIMSSALNVKGNRMDRLLNLCKKFGADTFYEGAAGRDYIDDGYFAKNGIKVEYQDYRHP